MKTALEQILQEYIYMKKYNQLDRVIFVDKFGDKHGIANPKALEVILDAAIEELKRQISE